MTLKVTDNLVGGSSRTKYPSQSGSEWSLNIYPEKNGGVTYMASVPGLKFMASVASGETFRGCYVSSTGLESEGSQREAFAVYGSTLYRFDASMTAHVIGTVNSLSTRVCFAESGGPRPFLYLVDGTGFFYYDLSAGGTLSQGPLPDPVSGTSAVKPTHISVVGGVLVINDTGSGYAYYSAPYPLAASTRTVYQMSGGSPVYDSTGVKILTQTVSSADYVWMDDYGVARYFNAESSSDKVSAVYAVASALYLFGPSSVEIWQRGSDAYSSFVRTSYTANAENGLDAPDSVASVNSVVFYVASGKSSGKCVMAVSGTEFTKISEPWLDARLLISTGACAFAYSQKGHSFYVLQLDAETWVYDASLSQWHQRASRSYATGALVPWRVAGMAWRADVMYAFTGDGSLCVFSDSYFSEDFSATQTLPMVRKRQTAVIVDDYKPFTFDEMSVECNVGTWDDYSLTPLMLLEVSDDGGMTFGNSVQEELGRTGQYSARVRFLGLGLNRLCVVRLTYSNPTDLVLTASAFRVSASGAMI